MPAGYDSTQAREQSLLVQLELLERDAELAMVADVIGAIRHGGRLLAPARSLRVVHDSPRVRIAHAEVHQ